MAQKYGDKTIRCCINIPDTVVSNIWKRSKKANCFDGIVCDFLADSVIAAGPIS